MEVKEKEICPKCDRIGSLTKDHVIPKVFVRQLKRFGIELPKDYVNTERICAGCNGEKGNSLDMSDFLTIKLIKRLNRELQKRVQAGETIAWGRLEQYKPYLDAIHSCRMDTRNDLFNT